jgi:hypothetical protein
MPTWGTTKNRVPPRVGRDPNGHSPTGDGSRPFSPYRVIGHSNGPSDRATRTIEGSGIFLRFCMSRASASTIEKGARGRPRPYRPLPNVSDGSGAVHPLGLLVRCLQHYILETDPPQSPQGQPQHGQPPSANALPSSFHKLELIGPERRNRIGGAFHRLKLAPEDAKFADLGIDLRHSFLEEFLDVSAGTRSAIAHVEQVLDIAELEPERLGPPG